MGYFHTMHVIARIYSGVTVRQVADAFKPIMDYFGHDGVEAFAGGLKMMEDNEFFFDPETRDLGASTYGMVGSDYYDSVLELASNLNKIAAEPGEIVFYNHDTGYIEESKSTIEFGPSEEAIKAYIARRDIEAGLRMMEPHLSDDVMAVVRQAIASAGR